MQKLYSEQFSSKLRVLKKQSSKSGLCIPGAVRKYEKSAEQEKKSA
jgi:hypothetical protein